MCVKLSPVPNNVAQLVSRAASRFPEAPAIINSQRTVVWGELERLVRAFAGGLRARGIGAGDRVAIVTHNIPEFAIAYFGTLRAGAVAVPINPSYTSFEINHILASSGAQLVVTDTLAHAAVAATEASAEIVTVGSPAWHRILVGSTPPPAVPVGGEALAVILFTSGTSGQPKGAMITHNALLANVQQLLELPSDRQVATDDVVLVALPLFHSYGLNAALGLIAHQAATAVLLDNFDAASALAAVHNHDVTIVVSAPPLFNSWLQQANLVDELQRVRMLISGAAALPARVFNQYLTQIGLPVWEGYGMTEAGPVLTSALASPTPKPGSVGRPLPGVDMRIIDENGHDVDDGDPGEILVRGPNLFRGYWPEGSEGPDEAGWWRTSDVGFLDSDGDLFLIDRRNDLIIVNGFNVYPREVEEVLALMPQILESAVMGTPDPNSGETVKALIVTSDDSLTCEDVTNYCRTRLARYKCPTIVEFVSELPHSHTGKVSKGQLRASQAGLLS